MNIPKVKQPNKWKGFDFDKWLWKILKTAEAMEKKEKKICELCKEELTEKNKSENHSSRCRECFEEWGDLWPDQV